MRTTLCDDLAHGWTLPQIARRRDVSVEAVRTAAGLGRGETYVPSRRTINQATAAIRRTWTDAERRARETQIPYFPI